MNRFFSTLAFFAAVPFSALAELYQFDVRAVDDQSPKSEKRGFSVVLVDSHSDEQLVVGVAAVPKTFGSVETAVLLVIDQEGERLARAVLAPQELSPGSTDYEFNLRQELLRNSVLLVSHRDGNDLHIAKFILGSFHVRDFKE